MKLKDALKTCTMYVEGSPYSYDFDVAGLAGFDSTQFDLQHTFEGYPVFHSCCSPWWRFFCLLPCFFLIQCSVAPMGFVLFWFTIFVWKEVLYLLCKNMVIGIYSDRFWVICDWESKFYNLQLGYFFLLFVHGIKLKYCIKIENVNLNLLNFSQPFHAINLARWHQLTNVLGQNVNAANVRRARCCQPKHSLNSYLFWGQLCHSLAVFSHSLLSSLAISLSLSLSSSVFSMCNAYTRWSAPHRFCWLFWLVNIDEPVLYYNLTSHNNIIVIVTHRISCVVLEDSTWLYFFALRYDNTSAQSRVRVKYTTTYTGRVFTCERQQMCSGLVSVVQLTAMTEDDEKHHSTATHTHKRLNQRSKCAWQSVSRRWHEPSRKSNTNVVHIRFNWWCAAYIIVTHMHNNTSSEWNAKNQADIHCVAPDQAYTYMRHINRSFARSLVTMANSWRLLASV